MAEELDIRSVWKKSKEKENLADLGIESLEKKKGTKTTLHWIRIILWIEFCINLVCLPILFFLDIDGFKSLSFKAFFVTITIIYLIYYQFLIREINRFSYDRNVVQNLKKVYGYLKFYLLHYKVVIWLSLLVGMLIGILDPKNQEVLSNLNSTNDWISFILTISILIGIMGGILTFLIHLIYGRKIKRLKRMVKDLERVE